MTCSHLGPPLLDSGGKQVTEPCPPPSACRAKVFHCNHPDHEATTLLRCRSCPDNTEGRAGNVSDAKKLIESKPPGFARDRKAWARRPETVKAMVEIFDSKIPHLGECPGHMKGRGIVIAGGYGVKPQSPHGYFPSAYVLVRKLRHLGCKLPVELWHLGPYEMDRGGKRVMEEMGVGVVDALEVARVSPSRILAGWELKPFATLHSSFREVLFLDADNCPLRDPGELFDWKPFRESGAVFWPDYPKWDLKPEIFPHFGVKPTRGVAFESGQYLIDKGRCWGELRLAMWYCEYSDYAFEHVYGDKETFHLAWRRLGREYAMPPRRPGWKTHTIIQHDFENRPIFLHRCQDKWRYGAGNRRVASLPDEDLHFKFVGDLREVWDGRPWHNARPSPEEVGLANSLSGKVFIYERVGIGTRPLGLEPGGAIGLGRAGCEQNWSCYVEKGRHLLAVTGKDGLTFLLERFPDRTWRGSWLIHEKNGVIMTERS